MSNRTGRPTVFNKAASAYANHYPERDLNLGRLKIGSDEEQEESENDEFVNNNRENNRNSRIVDKADELEPRLESPTSEKKITKLPPLIIEVMDEIKKSWVFTMSEQYNSVPHALTLLDNSSLGRDYKAFEKSFNRLETAMDLIVNDYHQGFNSAIQKFSGVVENITESQSKVGKMRESLENSKSSLGSKSFDLFHLWLKSNQYNEMTKILDRIEYFIKSSDKGHHLLQEKFWRQASKLIKENLRELNTVDFLSIGALEDIRTRLHTHQQSLPETLIEELNQHLYFKNIPSLDRFNEYENDTFAYQSILRKVNDPDYLTSDPKEDFDMDPETDSFEYIKSILMALHTIGCLPEALKTTRERISSELYFMIARTIAEVEDMKPALLKQLSQQKKPSNSDFLSGSVSPEDEIVFNNLIKNLFRKLYGVIQGYHFVYNVLQNMQNLDSSTNYTDEFQIRDLWMIMQNEVKAFLYDHLSTSKQQTEKPVAVVESFGLHAKSSHVAKQLIKVTIDADDKNLDDMYNTIQNPNETFQIMKSSSTDKYNHNHNTNSNTGIAVGGLVGVMDRYSNQLATSHRVIIKPDTYLVILAFLPTQKFVQRVENLLDSNMGMLENFLNDFILSVYIPQLQDRAAVYIQNYVHSIDAFQTEFSAHSAPFPLCKSSIAILSLVKGLCRAISLLPVNQEECIQIIESSLIQYYEKSVKKFYATLRQENTTVSNGMANNTFEDQDDLEIVSLQWAQHEDLAQLLRQKMKRYLSDNHKSIVPMKSNDELNTGSIPNQSGLSTGDVSNANAEPATKSNINSNNNTTSSSGNIASGKSGLSYKEAILENKLKGDRSLHRSELLFEQRKLQTLAHLHYSMDWIIDQLSEMLQLSELEMQQNSGSPGQHYSPTPVSQLANNDNTVAPLNVVRSGARRNTLIDTAANLKGSVESFVSLAISDDIPIGLPVFEDMVTQYQTILLNFRKLSEISLFTLRLEFRCHAMYFLDLAIREGNYFLSEESNEPDPYIWALNADLTTAEETMMVALPKSRIRYIFDGMAHLVAHILITNLKYIKHLNAIGMQKLVKNVRSLQQNLTNVVSMHEKDLDKARQYYDLLFVGGQGILNFMEAFPGKFNFDEYKALLDLVYDEALNQDAENSPARQEYSYCLKKMKGHFLKIR